MADQLKFDQILEIDGQKLTKAYIQSLSKQERLNLVDPIFDLLRKTGFIYMDNISNISKSWQRLVDYKPNIDDNEMFNNSSLATDICKYFCHSFYLATERGKPNIINNFNDDDKLKRVIVNRLGLDWLDDDDRGPGVNEAFNLSFKMIAFQGQRSMRMTNATSMFKPNIAKFICMKYSKPDDLVGDYSCGFGGRLLGTMSCGRRYIGTDPLTVPELNEMIEFFGFKGVKLIHTGSEDYKGLENSVDLYWSSPPYNDQEYYSDDSSQAYNKGEDYFYNTYWKNTLTNVKYMLKPNKWFGLNVKNDKMLDMAREVFGKEGDKVGLRTVRNHLTKSAGIEKYEYIYMFVNR